MARSDDVSKVSQQFSPKSSNPTIVFSCFFPFFGTVYIYDLYIYILSKIWGYILGYTVLSSFSDVSRFVGIFATCSVMFCQELILSDEESDFSDDEDVLIFKVPAGTQGFLSAIIFFGTKKPIFWSCSPLVLLG